MPGENQFRFTQPHHLLRVERPRRVLEQLFLPGVDLVRVNLVAMGQINNRRLFPHRLQGDFRLQRRVDLASRLLCPHPLRLSNEAATFQLSPWS